MPAMASATKFTFDLDFDAPNDALQVQPEVEEPEVEEEEEQAPTFDEEELEAARAEGFDAGKEEGRKEAAAATEQRLLESVETACQELAQIFNAQAEANQDIAKEMIEISTVIAKKMFPDLNARNALGEVERVVQDTLKAITDEPRAQIMVHPDLREPLTERLAAMTQRAGFEGKVFVNPDTTVKHGDCRVEWSHGAAVRDSETMLELIDEIIDRNLHGEEAVVVNDEDPAHESPADEPVEDSGEQLASGENAAEELDREEAGAEQELSESATQDTQDTAEEALEPEQDALDEETQTTEPDEDVARADDHFVPSALSDEAQSDEPIQQEAVENQEVADEVGEPPIPHLEDDRDGSSDDSATEADEDEHAPQMINSDPVSPDMTAAILDAQGAMSEEEDK